MYKARSEEIIVEELPNEVLIYDLQRNRAHCLNRVAAAVWRACDGRRDPAAIRAVAGATLGQPLEPAAVDEALAQLGKAHLLVGASEKGKVVDRGRRALLTGLLVPVVLSISTRAAAQAVSCVGQLGPCTPGLSRCCNGLVCRRPSPGAPNICLPP
jgi:hypothetical protein